MKATQLLAILAVSAILVMGVGTFVLMGGIQTNISRPAAIASPTTAQGTVTAHVIARPTTTTGLVYVNVLP